ncbi:hypothetical protein EGR_09679 [Echinococcus granulosus]|uniref:Uncharacterized protein n=1 Tax=Echinococcus granulosus TaxID=6210 RepID=W6U4K6_ECHGR|nr:hypothetical protein EGR_09679 [Echinococcus granulosus]EUB55471.1 hypothetical protein EGR_09679 [Echinococcus granulosus]
MDGRAVAFHTPAHLRSFKKDDVILTTYILEFGAALEPNACQKMTKSTECLFEALG